MAMRMAVMALRKAADARMNRRKVIRVSHSSLSRSVMEETVYRLQLQTPLFCEWRGRIVRELVFAGVGAFHLQLAEKQRWTDDRGGRAAAAVAHERIVADGDQVIADRANVQLVEDRAAYQFFVAVFRVDAIQKPRRIAGAERVHAIAVGLVLVSDHLNHFLL